jgi:hypothetical protein
VASNFAAVEFAVSLPLSQGVRETVFAG